MGKLTGILAYPRILVYLRRIARELQRSNEIAEARLSAEYPMLYRSYRAGVVPKTPKMVEITIPTTEDWNKRWRVDHPTEEEEG